MSESNWLKIALSPSVVHRAILYSAVVGPILCIINHYDVFLSGEIDVKCMIKMGLTFVVPYVVSTFSSVGAILKTETTSTEI